MLCRTIATVQNGKIRNEPIYRSLLRTFDPTFINIQVSSQPLIEPTFDVPLAKNPS